MREAGALKPGNALHTVRASAMHCRDAACQHDRPSIRIRRAEVIHKILLSMAGRAAAKTMASAGLRTPKGFKKVLAVQVGSGIDQHGRSEGSPKEGRRVMQIDKEVPLDRCCSYACRARPHHCSQKGCRNCPGQRCSARHHAFCSRWTGWRQGMLCCTRFFCMHAWMHAVPAQATLTNMLNFIPAAVWCQPAVCNHK